MKRLPTFLVASLALHLTTLPLCDAGNFRCWKPRTSNSCVVATPCAPVCAGTTVAAEFEPSDLNIQLTGEIVALRNEIEALKLAAADKDNALEASQKLVAVREKEAAEETERASKAEQALAAVKTELAKSLQELATVNQGLAKARQSNQQLRTQLAKSKEQLVSNKQEPKAKQEKPKQKRQPEKQAAQTPPVKVEKERAKKDAPPKVDADKAEAPKATEAPKAEPEKQ